MATIKIMNMKNEKRNELININRKGSMVARTGSKIFDENGTNSVYMRVSKMTNKQQDEN